MLRSPAVTAYIIRRLLILIPLLLVMSFVTFMFIQLAPCDYFAAMKMNPQISDETIAKLQAQYHLDKPPLIQYAYWLKNLARLDLGYSVSQKQPVFGVIASRLVNTLLLAISSILIAWLVAIPIGIYSAVHQYSIGDKIFSTLAFIGMSLPSFFMALLMLYFLGSELGLLPLAGMKSAGYDELSALGKIGDIALHLVIPATVLAIGGLAGLQRDRKSVV